MKLAIYHRTVPPKNSKAEKAELLINFGQGARVCGDEVIDVHDFTTVANTVGVIQGWFTRPESAHLRLRQDVVNANAYAVSADSNLFLYKDSSNPGNYLRYSFNGIFPNTGIYCDDQPDPRRWNVISQNLGITVKDWRSNGSHILLCLQRNGGWSMGEFDVVQWTEQTIANIRRYTDRPIKIRAHPGDKKSSIYLKDRDWDISAPGRSLQEDLKNCWAVVNHNSSAVVGAAIEGIPIFVTDPFKSQCKDIANTDLKNIEQPAMPDRLPWLQRISMFHWSFDDLRSGRCWAHMRQYVSNR